MGSYYDIDAILTDAQKLPATFTITVPGLGVLDDNVGGDVSFPFPFFPSHLAPNTAKKIKFMKDSTP